MATSSIFANFVINDKETAESFVRALEASANDVQRKTVCTSTSTVTDPEAIRALLLKRKERR